MTSSQIAAQLEQLCKRRDQLKTTLELTIATLSAAIEARSEAHIAGATISPRAAEEIRRLEDEREGAAAALRTLDARIGQLEIDQRAQFEVDEMSAATEGVTAAIQRATAARAALLAVVDDFLIDRFVSVLAESDAAQEAGRTAVARLQTVEKLYGRPISMSGFTIDQFETIAQAHLIGELRTAAKNRREAT